MLWVQGIRRDHVEFQYLPEDRANGLNGKDCQAITLPAARTVTKSMLTCLRRTGSVASAPNIRLLYFTS